MKTKQAPQKGDIYAVHHGQYAGELLIFIELTNSSYRFLATPTMENRDVPFESFDSGRNNDIIMFVEKAPKYVIKVSEAQYKLNEKDSNNRRK